jgi:hypothetical protein
MQMVMVIRDVDARELQCWPFRTQHGSVHAGPGLDKRRTRIVLGRREEEYEGS